MPARYFFVFEYTVSPAENNSRDTFLKTPILGILYSLSIFETLYIFRLTLSVTNLALEGLSLLLSRIPYLRL